MVMAKRTYGLPRDLYYDAMAGDADAIATLEMEADTLDEEGETILHNESWKGNTKLVQFILREFANKNLLVKLNRFGQTALHLAVDRGSSEVVDVLIDAARRNLPSASANDDTQNQVSSFQAFIRLATGPMGNTALHLAVLNGNVTIVKLIVDADPNNSHVKNNEGKTPIYIAAEKGYKDIVKLICTTCTALSLDGPCGGTTALHALIQNLQQGNDGDRDLIMMTINAAKRWSSAEGALHESFEALFNRTDQSGRTVLELAVYGNHVNAVELILLKDPAYQDGRRSKNHGLLHLIYKAEKHSEDIVRLLSQTFEAGINPEAEINPEAGINPHLKRVLTLILAIQRRDRDFIVNLLEGGNLNVLLRFVDSGGWTPLHYAAYHEFDSILDVIIDAQEENQFEYEEGKVTPFHVAAQNGYTSTVIRLMQIWPVLSSAYTSVNENGQNILHLAAVHNNKEMVNGILKYCPPQHKDNLLNQQDINGDTPLHLLVSRGCFIPEIIKYMAPDTVVRNAKYFTPADMLYFQHDIIGDQVQIKIALDDVQTSKSSKFWHKSMGKKTDIFQSFVLPSRRERKDVIFNEHKMLLMVEKQRLMKKDLEKYREMTNTPIIVTALITTVTFTVGFTMPDGLHQSGEVDEGLAVLTMKAAFNAFMVSDALALLLSTCSLFLYFLETMYEDPRQVSKLNAASGGLTTISVMAMMLTFITGTYLVLSHSPALAITVCLIGSFFFIFVIVLLIKLVYDHRVKRNED